MREERREEGWNILKQYTKYHRMNKIHTIIIKQIHVYCIYY